MKVRGPSSSRYSDNHGIMVMDVVVIGYLKPVWTGFCREHGVNSDLLCLSLLFCWITHPPEPFGFREPVDVLQRSCGGAFMSIQTYLQSSCGQFKSRGADSTCCSTSSCCLCSRVKYKLQRKSGEWSCLKASLIPPASTSSGKRVMVPAVEFPCHTMHVCFCKAVKTVLTTFHVIWKRIVLFLWEVAFLTVIVSWYLNTLYSLLYFGYLFTLII